MRLPKFLRASESLVGLDIGVSTLKVVELKRTRTETTVVTLGGAATPEGALEGSIVTNPKLLGRAISALCEASRVKETRAAIAVPGSSTFSKRLRMPRMPLPELSHAIRAEAAHFIPDDVATVKLDFHVLGQVSENDVEVLVVAVKEEVVDGYLAAATEAGIEVVVVDVDCFALQNCFEAGDASACKRTVGLIDVGSTFSSINICRAGQSIFTGDMSIGVGALFEDLSREFSLTWQQARALACAGSEEENVPPQALSIIDARLESLATECNRQLSFYWKAAGTGDSIDQVVLSGGGACVTGLAEKIRSKTGIPTEILDPFRGIVMAPGISLRTTGLESPLLGVAIGLALRSSDDRAAIEYLG
jgi:type IV pilus assembly protein PilM